MRVDRGRVDGDNGGGRWHFSLPGPPWKLSDPGETSRAGYSVERYGEPGPTSHRHALHERRAHNHSFHSIEAACKDQALPKHTVGGSKTGGEAREL